jgi:phosphopantetheinyl transferase
MIEVYLLEQSETEVPEDGDWLSESDVRRLEAMRFSKRRTDWRLGRWTAKCAVGISLKVDALAEIEVRASVSGAPEVFVGDRAASVAISLSHRAGVALCAVAPLGVALGCDLELIEARSEGFIADYFTVEEQALVAKASVEARPRIVALVWSAKESALKALQEGLRLDTRSVVVSLEEGAFDSAAGVDEWLPLQVRYAECQEKRESQESCCFHGWWQRTGKFVRTLVADPAPFSPVRLQVAASVAHRAGNGELVGIE